MVRPRSINKEKAAARRRAKTPASVRRGGKLSNTESPLDGKKSVEAELLPKKSRRMSGTRIVVSWIMTIYALCMFFFTQHIGNNITNFVVQIVCYKELVSIGFDAKKEEELQTFKYFYFYWAAVAVLFVWGTIFRDQWHRSGYTNITGFDDSLPPLEFCIYCLYIGGLIFLVFSLQKREHYKYQLQQFAFTQLALLATIGQGCCAIAVQYRAGLFFALISLNLVVCNDCFAYIFGKKFGKTPLIGLSPNKTWEGFLGAMIATFIDAILFSRFLTDPSYDPLYQLGFISKPFLQPIMTCKPQGIVGTSFSLTIPECDVLDIYQPRPVCDDNYPMLSRFLSFLPGGFDAMVCQNITWSSIQTHSVILAAFASLIAPFYGFIGSAVKRAAGVKDFGNLFPGHGGMTDRFDCNFGMVVFTYFYVLFILGPQVLEQ